MDEILIIICCAGAFGLLAYVATLFWNNRGEGKLRDRLKGAGKFSVTAASAKKEQEVKVPIREFAQRVGQLAAAPFMPKTREKQSSLRQTLAKAGIYSASAFRAMTGAKVIAMVVGLGIGYGIGAWQDMLFIALPVCGLGGYTGPHLHRLSRHKISLNQQALTEGTGRSSLDLMVGLRRRQV